jgi:hypothetical protein
VYLTSRCVVEGLIYGHRTCDRYDTATQGGRRRRVRESEHTTGKAVDSDSAVCAPVKATQSRDSESLDALGGFN